MVKPGLWTHMETLSLNTAHFVSEREQNLMTYSVVNSDAPDEGRNCDGEGVRGWLCEVQKSSFWGTQPLLGPWAPGPLSLILSCDSGFMINVFMNSLLLHIIVLFASVQRIRIFFSYTQQTIMDGDIPKCSSPRCTVSNKAINWQLKCVWTGGLLLY